jgi:hypothetical protein
MSVHNSDISSQHPEQRHLTSVQNNLPDCQNFGRLRWPFYYFCVFRQFRGKSTSAALPKPCFLINNVCKKYSQRTVVATHWTRAVRSSAHFAQRLVNEGPAGRTTSAQRRRVFLEYKETKTLFSMCHKTPKSCDIRGRQRRTYVSKDKTMEYGRVSNFMVLVSASSVINTTAHY